MEKTAEPEAPTDLYSPDVAGVSAVISAIGRIIRLVEYLGDYLRTDDEGMHMFDHIPSMCVNKAWDGCELRFNPRTGTTTLATWLKSGHNGDPYGYTARVLCPVSARVELEKLECSLRARAVQKARQWVMQESLRVEAEGLLRGIL